MSLKLDLNYKLLINDFPLDYAITLLHFEGLWGNSEVAKLNNNWGGMTWTGDPLRPSGIRVSKGTARPANEGGHYMRYDSVDDFLEDWAYLLRDGGIYKVSGAKTFDEAIKGMFRVGGAKYDYAASGYDHYLKGMRARREAINQANSGALDLIDKGVDNMTVTAQTVLNVARKHLGVTKYSTGHTALLNEYNSIKPLPVGYAVKPADDWCDMFVSVVAKQAGAGDLIGYECGVERHKTIFKQKGIWKGLVRPQAGDVIIWRWDGNRTGFANHIGFVESVNGDVITTIEGNTIQGGASKVGRNTYRWNAPSIQGYARPKYGAVASAKLSIKELAEQVRAGVWGNGADRERRLTSAGYDFNAVQAEVNRQSQPIVSFDDLVANVIAGKHGNGTKRVENIVALGHDPIKVQVEVNKRLAEADETPEEVVEEKDEQPIGGDEPKLADNEVLLDGVVYVITKK